MTRLLQPPITIQVDVVGEQPSVIVWGGHRYQVTYVANRWRKRIWWRDIWREYYKVIVNRGQVEVLLTIYKDLLDGTWYVQEIYD